VRTDTDLEALARAVAETHGRAAWVLLVEDDRGELVVLGNVGVESIRTLFRRWERQEREAVKREREDATR
jgi:hypothetical protein